MWNWAFRCILVIAVVLGALAAWSAYRGDRRDETFVADRPIPETTLLIDHPARDLGDLPVGEHVFEFAVTNTGNAEHRILGVNAFACGCNCCFMPVKDVDAVSIGPGRTHILRCTVRVMRPGPFDSLPITLFFDDGGARVVQLTVKGVGIPSPEVPGHDPTRPDANASR
jgi:hypothetical protein